jgi:hypothetical protein
MKLLTLITLLLPLISFAYNPHHKLTIVLADLEQNTQSRELVESSKKIGLEQLLFHCQGEYEGICAQDYYIHENTIYFHFDLHGSPYTELKQIVTDALKDYTSL